MANGDKNKNKDRGGSKGTERFSEHVREPKYSRFIVQDKKPDKVHDGGTGNGGAEARQQHDSSSSED